MTTDCQLIATGVLSWLQRRFQVPIIVACAPCLTSGKCQLIAHIHAVTQKMHSPLESRLQTQWLVRAAEPLTAAGVDASITLQARELIEKLGTDNQRAVARQCGQLEAFKRVAMSTTVQGEREDAERMFLEGRASLEELFSKEQKFDQIF